MGNAAQSLLNLRSQIGSFAGKIIGNDNGGGSKSKVDTSWHDQMVKEANEGFRKRGMGTKAAQKKQAKKGAKKTASKRYGK
jgi:hypothetical protein